MVITNWTNRKVQIVLAPPIKAKNIPLTRVVKAIEAMAAPAAVEAVEIRGFEAMEVKLQKTLLKMMQ